jgi:hypothetical protein
MTQAEITIDVCMRELYARRAETTGRARQQPICLATVVK